MTDPLHLSPYLTKALRGVNEVCRDEGYRARLRGDARKGCTYVRDDMRESFRNGWDAANDDLKIKEMIDDR